MRVIVGCERSQVVCMAFRKRGHEAYSCDILPCTGGYPEFHIQDDILKVLKREKRFDLGIFHPPCTFTGVSGALWYYHPDDKHLPKEQRRPHPLYPHRARDRKEAIRLFMDIVGADIERTAIEQPVSILSTEYRKPDQIIQPYMFGHEATKTTCLWLKNLPLLTPTKIVGGVIVLCIRAVNRTLNGLLKYWIKQIQNKNVSGRN